MSNFIANIKSNNHSLCTKLQALARNYAFKPAKKRKNRNALFFNNFPVKLQPQFNFKIPYGATWGIF